MNTYPLFMPPNELAEKGAKNWKKKEAQAYLEWFLNNKEQRVNQLLTFLGYQLTGDSIKDLSIISKLVYDKIEDPQFYTIRKIDNAKQLNDAGLAIAVDMGLLLAELLQKEKPSLHWEIGSGPKSYHSYNLPVLSSFDGNSKELDTLFLSIVNTGYSINVLNSPYDWATTFNDLKSRAK